MAHLALALDSTQQISPASCAARPGAVLMSESSEESPADLSSDSNRRIVTPV